MFSSGRYAITSSSVLALLLASCSGQNGSEPADVTSEAASAAQTLTCSRLKLDAGSIGGGQTAGNLATRQLSGTQDVWNDYVEFSPGASATCTFQLPASTTAASVSSLAVQVNYRGPTKADMRWTFEAWDPTTNAWVYVGDNGFARDWTWSNSSIALPGNAARFFTNGALQIRYRSQTKVDVSDVDQWVVLAGTDGGGGSGGSGGVSGSAGSAGSNSAGSGGRAGSGGTGGASGGSGGSSSTGGSSTGGSGGSNAAGAGNEAGAGGAAECALSSGACPMCIATSCGAEEAACIGDDACGMALSNDLSKCVCVDMKPAGDCATTFAGTNDTAAALATCAKTHCSTECGF